MNYEYFLCFCYGITTLCYCAGTSLVLADQRLIYKRMGYVLEKQERNYQLQRQIILLLSEQNALRKSEYIRKSTISVSGGGDTYDISLDGEQD